MKVSIDELTPEMVEYMNSWQTGTWNCRQQARRKCRGPEALRASSDGWVLPYL